MIHNDTWYEVKTHWGWFRLDEGAYRDYLEGKLWITWTPGKAVTEKLEVPPELMPSDISEQAIELRDSASRHGAFDTLHGLVQSETLPLPYKQRMGNIPIDEMNLSVRASNGLMRAGASTFGKLKTLMDSEQGLRGVRNLGSKSEKEITVAFVSACYLLLTPTEKAVFWQSILDKKPFLW